MKRPPIVLQSWGGSPWRAALLSTSAIALTGVAFIVLGLVCDRPRCRGDVIFGSVFLLVAVGVGASYLRRGVTGLQLRLDDAGFTYQGVFAPWDAVAAVGWRLKRQRGGPVVVVEVRMIPIDGYRPPRDRCIRIDHGRYRIPADVLIDAIAARAPRAAVFARDPDVTRPGGQEDGSVR